MTRSDRTLVLAARKGSADAAGELVRIHWRSVWRTAYAVTLNTADADDVAQDAFIRAFQKLVQFDAERSFEPWVTRIAVRLAIDSLRRDRRESPEAERLATSSHDALDRSSGWVTDVVRSLPRQARQVVAMRYWLDYSTVEIAEILGEPVGTVGARLSRATSLLRARLEAPDA